MSRTFKTVDYEAALDLTARLGECLPPDRGEADPGGNVGFLHTPGEIAAAGCSTESDVSQDLPPGLY